MNLLRKAIKVNFSFSIIWYHVKQRLMGRLIKLAKHFGLYVYELPSADGLYQHLTSDSLSIRESELKKTAVYLRKASDNKLYSEILHKFIPDLILDDDDSKFVGRGYSKTGLNVYRKLVYDDDILLEKVYFNSSHDLFRVKWFYENIYAHINCIINVPELYKTINGKLITVVYFRFVDLTSLALNDVSESVFKVSKEIYKLSLKPDIKNIINNAPELLLDFKQHFLYQLNIDIALSKAVEIQSDGFQLKDVEKRVSESHSILTHGDIHWGNIYENNYLIDWDSFGIYPLGLDVAYVFFHLHLCKFSFNELIFTLENEYRPVVLKEEWDDFELNFLFFYFVFTAEPVPNVNIDLSETHSCILNRIKQLHYKKVS